MQAIASESHSINKCKSDTVALTVFATWQVNSSHTGTLGQILQWSKVTYAHCYSSYRTC